MNNNWLFILVFGLFFMVGCGKNVDLGNFDSQVWIADKGGCKGQRASQITELKTIKKNLKGLSSNDFLTNFGSPDIQRLSQRNQEYFVYFLENGPHCNTLRPVSNAKTMVVRFSAIKLATEISFQNGADI